MKLFVFIWDGCHAKRFQGILILRRGLPSPICHPGAQHFFHILDPRNYTSLMYSWTSLTGPESLKNWGFVIFPPPNFLMYPAFWAQLHF